MKILLMALLCLVPISLFGQSPTLQLVVDNIDSLGRHNPDSIMVDVNTTSATYASTYIKKGLVFSFEADDVLVLPWSTTTSYVTASWVQINSTYASLKASFQDIYNNVGPYHLRKLDPSVTSSSYHGSQTFEFEFHNYVPMTSAVVALSTANVTRVNWTNTAYTEMSPPSDKLSIPGSRDENWPEIGSQDASFLHSPEYNRLGYFSHGYLTKVPIAWEITKGDGQVIAFEEAMKFETSHDDIDDNILIVEEVDGDQSYLQKYHSYLSDGHNLQVTGVALMNDNEIGSTGSAPNARGFGIDVGHCPIYMDCNGSGNGVYPPDVVNSSYTRGGTSYPEIEYFAEIDLKHFPSGPACDGYRITHHVGIDNGIVAVCAGSRPLHGKNGRYTILREITTSKDHAPLEFNPRLNRESLKTTRTKNINLEMQLKPSYPGGFGLIRYVDENEDIYYDYLKPLAISKGSITNDGRVIYGASQEFPGSNGKFATKNSHGSQWEYYRAVAYTDVIIPMTASIMLGAEESSYYVDYGSVSQAIAFGSGIAALCTSVVDKSQFSASERYKIHKRVYDAITFTATKTPDIANGYSTSEPFYSEYYFYEETNGESSLDLYTKTITQSGVQTEYVVQNQDYLRRSWAQRMGFGVVNAFRSVAHCIEAKAPHSISSASAIDWASGTQVGAEHFTHFGSWVETSNDNLGEGDNFEIPTSRVDGSINGDEFSVLEVGGVDMPGADGTPQTTEIHNNQGVTILSDDLTIEVSGSNRAVIDGILKSRGIGASATMKTKSGGEILITGYCENVDLTGKLKIDDLRFASWNGGQSVIAITQTSELYGKLSIEGSSSIVISENQRLDVYPGAEISLTNGEDIVVKRGAKLVLHHPSKVTGTGTAKIYVEAGGELVFEGKESNLKIHSSDIEVDVYVESILGKSTSTSGKVILEEGAFVKIPSFEIHGSLIMEDRSHLELTSSKRYNESLGRSNYLITGNIQVNGTNTEGSGGAHISAALYDDYKSTSHRYNDINFFDLCETAVQPAYIDFQGMSSYDRIQLANGGSIGSSTLSMKYTVLSDVYLTAVDVKVIECDNITATGHHEYLHDGEKVVFLGFYSKTANPDYDAQFATVSNSTFKDKSEFQKSLKSRQDEYQITGVLFDGFRYTYAAKCKFYGLNKGVAGTNSGFINVRECKFENMRFGIEMLNFTNSVECKNNHFQVRTGLYQNGGRTLVGGTVYQDVKEGIRLDGPGTARVANSTMANHVEGMLNFGSSLVLATRKIGVPLPQGAAMYDPVAGFNKFKPGDFNNSSYYQSNNGRTDIYLEMDNTVTNMKCGKNLLDDAATDRYHFYSNDFSISHNVQGDVNDFEYSSDTDHQIVKTANISVDAMDIETHSDAQVCADDFVPRGVCGTVYLDDLGRDVESLSPLANLFEDPHSNVAIVANAFEEAISIVRSTSASVGLKTDYLWHSYQTAKLLRDTVPDAGDTLVTVLEGIVDNTPNAQLKECSILIQAYIDLDLGNTTSATNRLNSIVSTGQTVTIVSSASMKLCELGFLSTQANLSQSSLLALHTLLSKYDNRNSDYYVPSTSGSNKQSAQELFPNKDHGVGSVKVFPNPTKGMTSLSVHSLKSEGAIIRVIDVNGGTLFERRFGLISGECTIDVSLDSLASGRYTVHIVSDSNVHFEGTIIKK